MPCSARKVRFVICVPPEAVDVVVVIAVVVFLEQALNAIRKPVIATAANTLPQCAFTFIFMVLNTLLLLDIMLI